MIRVTEVLSPWNDFSMVPPELLKLAAARGTKVHTSCASIARGLWTPRPAEIKGYIQSYERALVLFERVIFVEPELVSKAFGFKGHPDLGVIYKGED
jgi:hypothetical protein